MAEHTPRTVGVQGPGALETKKGPASAGPFGAFVRVGLAEGFGEPAALGEVDAGARGVADKAFGEAGVLGDVLGRF